MISSGKVAMVTGAGSGIGRATALALLNEGYSVVLAGRRPEALDRTVAAAGDAGSRALAVPADVSDPTSVVGYLSTTTNGSIRPHRPAVQQRRHECPGHPARRPDGRAVAARRRRQLDRRVPLHPSRLPAHEGAGAERRPDHQQRLDLGVRTQAKPNSRTLTSATKHAITGLTRSTSLDGRKYDIACGQLDIGNARDRG